GVAVTVTYIISARCVSARAADGAGTHDLSRRHRVPSTARARGRGLERPRPGLAHHPVAERVLLVLAVEREAGRLVDPAGGGELVVGQQDDFGVAGLAGEVQALGHQAGAEAEPAR